MRVGKIVGVPAILTDITGRKRAEEEIAMLARFPEENPNPILRVSSEGIVLYSNKPALVLLEAWGCNVGEALPAHLHRLVSGALNSRQAHEVEIECADRMFSIRLMPIVGSNYVNIYGRDITTEKLAKQKLIDDQMKLKSLASQLTLAEERERRRIAGELHDRISQSLAISKIKLEALRKSGYGEKLDKTLEDICNSLGQTIQDTRTLTFDIGNPILYELGFETAVSHWLTEQIQNKHKIKTEFKDDGQPKLLDDDIRILLFRSVRELLINVVKHSQASKVKVSIRKADNHICVEVEDNGVGFEAEKSISLPAKTYGFGLFSIRYRLEELGGHLEIESKPGRGCKVTMTAPLKRKETADGRNRATN
jgi:signal transduction histidine kinase